MAPAETAPQISLKNILYLTDFSAPSSAALPFATAISLEHEAKFYAMHVITLGPRVHANPEAKEAGAEAKEHSASVAMQLLESQLAGLHFETLMERGSSIWPAVERAISDHSIDLLVLGTHGRTGAEKFLLGSVAEEIFRRSPVPVLTIGPGVHGSAHIQGRFHRVLFATDFSDASVAAAPYAIAFARENHARFVLLHVTRQPSSRGTHKNGQSDYSVAETIQRLYETLPTDEGKSAPPEVVLEYGEPAGRIVATAEQRCADLIVLGVRNAAGHIGAATHLERTTAHKVVAHAACPVLTVRR